MRQGDVKELVCPECAESLKWQDIASAAAGEVEEGTLACHRCPARYPVRRHVPRFVPEANYCDSFSLQWQAHARIQLDSYNRTRTSYERLFAETKWDPAALANQRILECGSGSGRFTKVLLEAGAQVFSFDYSSAVDSNWANNGSHSRVLLAQGDIYRIPFRKAAFDKVLCFGVLQHTPDVRGAFMSMVPCLKPGGELVVDVYPKHLRELLHWKYLLRPVTKRMDKRRLYGLVRRVVPTLLPIALALGRVPLVGKQLVRLAPVNNPEMRVSGLSPEDLREWSILDTFDWFSPAYDQPQTLRTLRQWFAQAGLENASFERRMGVYVGRGSRPSANATSESALAPTAQPPITSPISPCERT